MNATLTNPKTGTPGARLILTVRPAGKLTGKAAHIAALERKAREKEALNARLEAERAESAATRAHIKGVVATQVWEAAARGGGDALVAEVERGPTKLLARDGLLWLVEKRRINQAQRMAGERYRGLYAAIHGGGVRSCIGDRTGGGAGSIHGSETLSPLQHTAARDALEKSRRHGLVNDNVLIWVCDEVCGKGTTLRDMAAGNQKRATELEAELSVALRFLARHYGFAS